MFGWTDFYSAPSPNCMRKSECGFLAEQAFIDSACILYRLWLHERIHVGMTSQAAKRCAINLGKMIMYINLQRKIQHDNRRVLSKEIGNLPSSPTCRWSSLRVVECNTNSAV